MSVTLATVADALIEFILSLLRDPTAAAEFDADPEGTLASRGLGNVSHADVCAVAPVIVERTQVVPVQVQVARPQQRESDDPAVREIRQVTNNFSYTDDRQTILDQSVNQNIWAEGDVTQTFDNDAIVASGDGSLAAGGDVDIVTTVDESTDITAGEDVNIGNDTETTVTEGSGNEVTETTTTTDASETVVSDSSNNDTTTTETAEDSYNDSAATYTETAVDTESDAIVDSTESAIVDDSADDGL